MRRDKVQPTRAAILKWMIKQGYVITDPPDHSAIRAACLPRVKGKIGSAGIRIFDPSTEEVRYVPGLVYNSAALRATGLTDTGFSQDVWVHLNPADIGKVWLSHRGLIEAELLTHDAELATLSLREYLQIAEDDRLAAYLTKARRLQVMANDGMERYDSEKEAKAKKKSDADSAAQRAGGRRRISKPQAAQMEAAETKRRELGIDADTQAKPAANQPIGDKNVECANEPEWVIRARANKNQP
jgi:hypothetical protein